MGMSAIAGGIQKIVLDFYPNFAHIILHPHPMRDWTRAVVFGWVGSGSCGAAYRRLSLGRSIAKGVVHRLAADGYVKRGFSR